MQLSSQARKAMAGALAASTLLWAAVGFVPQIATAAVHSEGCLVLSGGIVWMITNGTRRGYTSAEVFQSYGYNFSQVTTASAEDVALPVGPIMIYSDGTLVKGPSDPLVYLVAGGQKRPFVSGSVFTGLGYSFANIQQAPVNTFSDLPTGSNLDSTAMAHPAGTKVISNGAIWLMSSNGRMGFPSAANFLGYGYKFANVVAANSYDLASANQGDVPARPACTGGGGTTPPPVTSGSVNVTLNGPSAGSVVIGQATANLGNFVFSGSGTVTSVTFKRTGISADSTLANVYLFDGATRLTDGASISGSSSVTFTNGSGLFTVSGSKTISAKADIAGSSGETVGLQMTAANVNGGTVGGLPVSGPQMNVASATLATVAVGAPTPGTTTTDPSLGVTVWESTFTVQTRDVTMNRLALRQINSAQTSDTANYRLMVDGTQVASQSSLDANGYVTFSFSTLLKTGARDIKVIADVNNGSGRIVQMSLRTRADLELVDSQYNVGLGTTSVTGTFPATTGTITINNGSMTVQKAADSTSANLVNAATSVSLGKWTMTAFGEPVKIDTLTAGITYANAGAIAATGTITVVGDATTAGDTYATTVGAQTAATVTWAVSNTSTATALAAAIDALSSYAATASSNVVTVTASTPGTVGNVTITTVTTDGGGTAPTAVDTDLTGGVGTYNAAATLRNGQLYVNGSQYGSTQTLTHAGVAFTINYTVTPGTPVTVELKGDVFDNDGTGVLNSSDTIKTTLVQGSGNGTRQISFGTINVPTGDTDANTLTVATGSLSMAKQGNYADRVAVSPQTAYKLGAYNLSGNATEDVMVNTISIDFGSTGGGFPVSALQNVYVKAGSQTSSMKSTVSATSNSYSVSFTLPKNTVVPVEIYGDIAATATANGMQATTTVTGNTASSGNSVNTGAIAGQTITAGAGNLTEAAVTTPAAAIAAGNSQVTVATYKFTATNDSYTITDLTFTVSGNTTVTSVLLQDNGSTVAGGTQSVGASNIVTFSGLSIPVSAGSNKNLTIALQLGNVGTAVGGGTSGESITVRMTTVKATKGSGGVETDSSLTYDSQAFKVFKAIPTITTLALSNSLSVANNVPIYKFSINTNGTGTIAWKDLVFTVASNKSTTTIANGSHATLWDADSNTQIAGTATVAGLSSGAATGSVKFVADSEQEISGAKNYILKADIGGTPTTSGGDALSSNLAASSANITNGATAGSTNDAATVYNSGTGTSIVWSDESATTHAIGTFDWYSDYLVKNLPSDSQTLHP